MAAESFEILASGVEFIGDGLVPLCPPVKTDDRHLIRDVNPFSFQHSPNPKRQYVVGNEQCGWEGIHLKDLHYDAVGQIGIEALLVEEPRIDSTKWIVVMPITVTQRRDNALRGEPGVTWTTEPSLPHCAKVSLYPLL